MTEDKPSNVDHSLLDERIERALDRRGLARGGPGSSGGSMDAWQQSVENRLGNIQAELLDVRTEIRVLRSSIESKFLWLIGALIAVFGGLLGTMAKGFGWL
jgi:hypothetical protein